MKKKNYLPQRGLNYYQDGGDISISPKREGKFTEFARSIGMDVQTAAAHVLAHKDKYSPMRVKQANFARNAAKFKHADGGEAHTPGSVFGAYHYALPSALALRLTGMYDTPCPDCEPYLPKEQYGGVSTEGYRSNSPDRFNPYNIIPSGNISMQNVPHPVFGMDNMGTQQMMYPGGEYQFPGQTVFELPMRRMSGKGNYQQGGEPYQYEQGYMQTGGDTTNSAPEGYAPSTPQERTNWNQFLDYLQSKGVAGSKDMDARDKNLGLSYLNEYNKANPNAQIPQAFIPRAQYENYLIRKQGTFPGLQPSEAQYAFNGLSAPYKQRPISAVDNWLGSYTSQEYYPRFNRGTSLIKADGTKQSDSYDFGTDFQSYVQSLNDPDLATPFRVNPTTTAPGSKRLGGQYGKTKYKKNKKSSNNYYQKGGVYNSFLYDPDQDPTYLESQVPNMSNFFQQKRIASKDNQNPLGVNDPYATIPATDSQAQYPFQPQPKPQSQTSRTWNPGLAGGIIAGMSFLNNALEANDRNRYKDWMRMRGMSDSFAPVMPVSRGDYSFNGGYIRPDRGVPVQYGATPMAQDGGIFDNPITDIPQLEMPADVNPSAGMPMAQDQYASMPTAQDQYASMPTAPMPSGDQSNVAVPVANMKGVRLNNKAREAFDYYVNEKKLPPQVAAGIVGNLFWESGLNPEAKERGNTGAGRGIAQWGVNDRWKGFQNWARENGYKDNLQTQLTYVVSERGISNKAINAAKKANTPEEASYIFGKIYEKPLDKKDVAASKNPARWDIRAGIARQLFNEYQSANQPSKEVDNGAGPYVAEQPAYPSQPADAQASYRRGGIVKNKFMPLSQSYQEGGEYMVTPSQLQFILAHGGEIEFL